MPSMISLIASFALTARAEDFSMEAPSMTLDGHRRRPEYRTPGVYIEEISSGPRPVSASGSGDGAAQAPNPDGDDRRRPEISKKGRRRAGDDAPNCAKLCSVAGVQGSVYCRACRNGQDTETFCNGRMDAACIKYKVADSVCVMAGELNSLAEGLQVGIASGHNDCLEWPDVAQALQDGTLDASEIDRCWSGVVGNEYNFGEDQWALGFYFARTKQQLGSALFEVFDAMDSTLSGRRRADGYSSNKSGTSSVFNMLNPDSEAYVSPLAHCDRWLKQQGSGLQNPGMPCEIACEDSLGFCDYCGSGKCCKDGSTDGACTGEEGGADRYICVPSYTNPVQA